MNARTLHAGRRAVATGSAARPWRGRLLRWIGVHFAPLRARHEMLDAPAQPRPRPMAPR